MTDLLLSAARRLGVPTETSAGAGVRVPAFSIWARCPRHPCEIAHDVLTEVVRADAEASLTPVGGTPLWRARHGEWTHIGRFEDAVAHLANQVAGQPVADEPAQLAGSAAGLGTLAAGASRGMAQRPPVPTPLHASQYVPLPPP
ncbi:MAG: hypothetical protein WDO56_13315 [Gammaproteobacteria bacterium]